MPLLRSRTSTHRDRSLRRHPRLSHLTGALLAVVCLAAALAPAATAQVSVRLRSLGRSVSLAPAEHAAARPAARAGTASAQPLDPSQIRRAYSLPATGARGQRIAIITAFDDPYAESDLAAYDRQWGLPACTTANHCFEKLNQDGKVSPLPPTDLTGGTWITESAIGTEIAHGVCESCRIMLVEARTTGRSDFSAAVAAAAKAGATVIVTTFFDIEQNIDPSYALDYLQPRAAVVAAVGDAQGQYGYTGEASFPSSMPSVLAVGGTTLTTRASGAYVSERVWDGTVSGCSLYQPAPSWQGAIARSVGCQTRRAVADVAATADPGAAVHITGNNVGGGPWYAASGTSLSAPIIGAVIGLAGSVGSREPAMLYSHAHSDPGALHDVTSGVNASGCTAVICRAGKGYDGPTGFGTPYGLAAFLASGGALDRRHPEVWTSAAHRALHASRSWTVRLGIHNANAFAVSGSVVLRRTLRIGGRVRTIRFAADRFRLAPLTNGTLTLTVVPGERALLRRLRALNVYVWLSAQGPVRPVVKRNPAVSLSAP